MNNPKGRSDQKHLPTAHDNIVLFSTDGAVSHGWKPENKVLRRYRKQDEDGSFREIDLRKTGDNDLATDRPNMAYPFAYNQVTGDLYPTFSDNCPDGYFFIYPMKDEKTKGRWRWEMKTSEKNISRLLAKYQPQKQQWTIFEKDYLGEDERVFPTSIWDEKPFNSERGTESFINLGFDKDAFVRPKPVGLLLYLFEHLNRDGKFALDYFAGSGTTGHALINLNRDDGVNRNYILIEQGDHFDTVLKARIQKVVYSKEWKDGKPISREGISHCFKTLRLESYEDTLNNLVLKTDSSRDAALVNNPSLQRDYLLNYFLDVETESSQSLLNIADFRDPTAYQMRIKKPGSGEQALQNIDLIETFNWLIGLWVEQMAVPQVFSAEFERETDPDLPKDQNTRLICKRLKADANGAYWFRLIEGYTLKIPGDNTSKVPTLIVWRKQTDDPEKDNAVLQKYLLEKLQISPREQTYGVIYINGSHTLPNPVVEGEQTKVRLIEEAFHNAMWSGEVG